MAWRMVRQPNGKLARFSDVVDDFTDYDLSDQEAFELCRDMAGVYVAKIKICHADAEPQRFAESLETIRLIHGNSRAEQRASELST